MEFFLGVIVGSIGGHYARKYVAKGLMWAVQNKVDGAAKKLGAKLGATPLVAVAATCRALKAHDIRLAAPPHPSLVVLSIIEWGNQHTGLVKGHIEAVEKEVSV